MAATDRMTAEEYTIYSAINHADDEWTPEATAALKLIKAVAFAEGYSAGFHDEGWPTERPQNPYL